MSEISPVSCSSLISGQCVESDGEFGVVASSRLISFFLFLTTQSAINFNELISKKVRR